MYGRNVRQCQALILGPILASLRHVSLKMSYTSAVFQVDPEPMYTVRVELLVGQLKKFDRLRVPSDVRFGKPRTISTVIHSPVSE